MTKKEFMAISLPYDVYVKCGSSINIFEPFEFTAEFTDGSLTFLPVLHPLSDLTKEIENNGKKFVPLDILLEMYSLNMYQFTNGEIYNTDYARYIEIEELPFEAVLKLIEWHFDIASLIEKGEIIDVNILETNPYK